MKRSIEADGDAADKKMKKMKPEGGEHTAVPEGSAVVLADENLLYEVLKHADARTLAAAACVSKQWLATARDERLWELICTKPCANVGGGNHQLRSVVLALGGFRRLHSLYLLPLSKPSSSSSLPSSTWPCLPPPSPVVPAKSSGAGAKTRWGKDEVDLSLSLLSIRHYEKMNFSNRGKGH
uniref:F-box protein GID2 n=1 Tax=Actinidia deliciosa TaxID=3627 RepID=V5QMV7_ACTDE|nr:GA signaling F-Box [Actinidia deliciosa]